MIKKGEINMSDFNVKIWLKKWGYGLLAVNCATVCLYTADYINSTENIPVNYAALGGFIVIVLTQIGNWIKHTYTPEAK